MAAAANSMAATSVVIESVEIGSATTSRARQICPSVSGVGTARLTQQLRRRRRVSAD